MQIEATNHVLYVANKFDAKIIDTLILVDGKLVTQFSKESVFKVRARHPDVKISSYEDAIKEIESFFIKAPWKIDAEQWSYFQGVMPPAKWQHTAAVETFMLQERTYGSITSIFCRIGSDHYMLRDRDSLNQIEIYNKVVESLA